MPDPKQRGLLTRVTLGTLRHSLRLLVAGVIGGLLVAIVVAVVSLERRPDLEVWHEAKLDEEFNADSEVESFADYLALEDRLFQQLQEEVYDEVPEQRRHSPNRYSRGSISDPELVPGDWNRSSERPHDEPKAGALLLHGLSDSPYSMRSLADRLHAEGVHVVVMRVPGHGTAPSGLVHVEWPDMEAAVKLGARHLRNAIGDAPLYLVGYSNGAALSVVYALAALEDDSLPLPDGLVLLSPAIGITPLAALAIWQERLGHLLGFRKLAWSSILLEYDPFKYGSFAINAGKLSHELTVVIQRRIDHAAAAGELERFPRLLAFQSVVDATVDAAAVVQGLFDRLPEGAREFVLFDVNRNAEIETLLDNNPTTWVDAKLKDRNLSFDLTVISNETRKSEEVVAYHRKAHSEQTSTTPLALRWPQRVYSLSHVALPFPPDDPIYGGPDAPDGPTVHLGNVALRGERGALLISAADQLRLRFNPFHSYLLDRTVGFVQGVGASGAPPAR